MGPLCAPHELCRLGDTTAVPQESVPHRAGESAVIPNPFNPSAVIVFETSEQGAVKLDVYDPTGRHVRALVNEVLESGNHSVQWDGMDSDSNRISSGTYTYAVTLNGRVIHTGKAVLLK